MKPVVVNVLGGSHPSGRAQPWFRLVFASAFLFALTIMVLVWLFLGRSRMAPLPGPDISIEPLSSAHGVQVKSSLPDGMLEVEIKPAQLPFDGKGTTKVPLQSGPSSGASIPLPPGEYKSRARVRHSDGTTTDWKEAPRHASVSLPKNEFSFGLEPTDSGVWIEGRGPEGTLEVEIKPTRQAFDGKDTDSIPLRDGLPSSAPHPLDPGEYKARARMKLPSGDRTDWKEHPGSVGVSGEGSGNREEESANSRSGKGPSTPNPSIRDMPPPLWEYLRPRLLGLSLAMGAGTVVFGIAAFLLRRTRS